MAMRRRYEDDPSVLPDWASNPEPDLGGLADPDRPVREPGTDRNPNDDVSDPYGRTSETPRDRTNPKTDRPGGEDSGEPGAGGGTGSTFAPPRRREPGSDAGATFMGNSAGVLPFSPMGGPGGSVMARPRMGALLGKMGGLKGGGLGVPFDPTSNAASDPIDTLIRLLTGGR